MVEQFRVADFGAMPDDEGDDTEGIREAIAAAVKAGTDAEVVLAKGTYRVRSGTTQCFTLMDAKGVTVRGAGVETRLVVTNPGNSVFVFVRCREVWAKDLCIDYDPVPFTQGTVTGVDVEAGHFDMEIDSGYPLLSEPCFHNVHEFHGRWGMIMDRDTRRIRAGTYDHIRTPKWKHLSGRVWRVFAGYGTESRLSLMRVGDTFVQLARGGAVFHIADSAGGGIENVTVYASPGLAVALVANQEQVTVRRLEVRFAPGTDRLLTCGADGVHCQQNRVGPLIENCYFEGMADDGVNIYCPPNILREMRSENVWLVTAGCKARPGDRFQVLDPKTGRIRAMVTAVEVKPEDGRYEFTLDRAVEGATAGEDHTNADALYNVDACGSGFTIRNNHFNGNRRYGVLIRAGEGLIENNIFENTTGAGVVLTNEPEWPEGPVPWGIAIRANRIIGTGACKGYADSPVKGAITVHARRLGGVALEPGVNNIIIEDNEIIDSIGAAIFVGGARECIILNNRIRARENLPMKREGGAIVIDVAKAMAIVYNTIHDKRPMRTSAVEIRSGVLPGEEGVRIGDLKASLSSSSKEIDDQRP